MVLSGVPRKKIPIFTPPGIDPGTSRLAAQCLNHYATPGILNIYYLEILQMKYYMHTFNVPTFVH